MLQFTKYLCCSLYAITVDEDVDEELGEDGEEEDNEELGEVGEEDLIAISKMVMVMSGCDF